MEKIIETLCRKHGIYTEFPKNTILNVNGKDSGNACVYYLISGVCALCGYSKNGTEHVFHYHMPDRLIGFNPYLAGNSPRYYAYNGPFIQTKTACRMYRIPVAAFRHYLDTSLEFNQYMVLLLSETYHHTLAHFKQTQEDNSAIVLCRFLLAMTVETPEGLLLPHYFTYNEISHYLGLHLVTVSKIILKLKAMGCVERTHRGLLIRDPQMLRKMITEGMSIKY